MKHLFTIRSRFILFSLLSLLPLMGFSWVLISENSEHRYNDLVGFETLVANQVTNSTTGYLNLSYRSLENLASNQVIIEQSDVDAVNLLLGQTRTIRPEQSGVFLINAEGRLVGNAGIDPELVLPYISSQIDSVLATGQRAVTGRIELPGEQTTNVFVVLVPVTSVVETSTAQTPSPPVASTGSNLAPEVTPTPTAATQPAGSIRGVVAAVIPTDVLAQTVLPTPRGRTEILILHDQQIIVATGDIRANEGAYIENLFSQNSQHVEEGADTFTFKSLAGTERVAVWSPIQAESASWGVLVTSPNPQNQLADIWRELLALLLLAGLVYGIMAFTFGELTSRNLADLTESARRLADGDYHTPIPRRGLGELQELRQSLSDLRESTELIMIDAERRQDDRIRQTEQMRDLLRRDLRMQEDERRHIASEIHDAVSPLITGALYQSRALQRANGDVTPELVGNTLNDVNDLLERASQELHGIVFDLRPPDLDDLGVVAAIEAFVSTIQRTGLEARLEVIDEPPPLSPEVRLGIYRIVQEALHNVLRHSGADEAVVRMEYVNQLLRVTVRDNGTGFDPESARRPTSLGLLSMRERAASIDADFEILSRPGGGTVIIVERRDTGSPMSDELLDSILRDRAEAAPQVDEIDMSSDNNGNVPRGIQ